MYLIVDFDFYFIFFPFEKSVVEMVRVIAGTENTSTVADEGESSQTQPAQPSLHVSFNL